MMHKALLGKSGVGKALPLDEPVLTPNGWVRNDELKIGDLVVGEDGKFYPILEVIPHKNLDIYKITFTDGTVVRSCKDHLWKVTGNRMRTKYTDSQIAPLSRLIPNVKRGEYCVPVVKPIEFEEKDQSIDSYTFGFLLGSESLNDSFASNPVIKCQAHYSSFFYHRFSEFYLGSYKDSKFLYLEINPSSNLYLECLLMDVPNWTSIPKSYLYGSVEQRKNLLAGFLEGSHSIILPSKTISYKGPFVKDVADLARSLGAIVELEDKQAFIKINTFNPFHIKTKQKIFCNGPLGKKCLKRIKSIKFDSVQDGSCILIGSLDQTFVTTGYTITHNSTTIRNLLKANPSYGLKTASTGIAAINLQDEYGSATTVNSALGFFDTKELLLQTLKPGRMDEKVNGIADMYQHLIIDEVSMISSAQIDLIDRLFTRVNEYRECLGKEPIYLHLVGDFGQLPCIEGKPAFMAKCWDKFDIKYLTEVKRQDEKDFIQALHHVRVGDGRLALEYFDSLGFNNSIDKNFQGTTIFSKNKDVDSFNLMKLQELPTPYIHIPSERSGVCKPEWKNIPDVLQIKTGCLVVILMNNHKQNYANGDLGIVENYDQWSEVVTLRLLRENRLVSIEKVKVKNAIFDGPPKGWIKYMPLRVAYASTCHKSQGLTLDKIQISMGDNFMSKCHGLFYVALSRVKTSSGLRLVGTKEDFLRSPCFDPIFNDVVR